MNCQSCNKYIEHVFDENKDNEQRDNALVVHFHGGYGMFMDPFEDETTNRVILCHDCAHDLCEKVPWIKELIQPAHSHAHSNHYHQNNPQHWGWDYAIDSADNGEETGDTA